MPHYISELPHLNALLNATSAVLLLAGYTFIRRNRVRAHRNCQVSALATSTVFLASYLTYHYYHGATRFPGQGVMRPIYFTILISHTILAIAIVPLVIVTFRRALRGDFERHRRIARWTCILRWRIFSASGCG